MHTKSYTFDRIFLVLTSMLVAVGLLSFFSGAFFLFSENSSIFWGTVARHLGLGAAGALIGVVLFRTANAKSIMKAAPWVAGITLCLTALVFVPGIGSDLGSTAQRWISIGGYSIQPGEFLKIGAVLGAGWWLSSRREQLHTIKGGLIPFWVILGSVGALLLLQPDTDGFLVIATALIAMYVFAGAPLKHIFISAVVVAVVGAGLVMTRPYLKARIVTFLNPSHDTLGSSYQVRQSLIAIGSGGMTGRGYGKGIHKYEYLPEPMSDALFAVIGEEWGIFGTVLVVILFFLWYVRALVLTVRSTAYFSRFVLLGFAHIIIVQAYLNILSNVGLFPFSGLPLPFMSQGGTALFVVMVVIGLMGSLTRTQIAQAHA